MPRRRKQVKEVKAKKEPKKKERLDQPIVVLFADIIGCSEISNHKKLDDYNKFLNDFHRIFRKVVEEHRGTFYEEHEWDYFIDDCRGDEGHLMIFVPGRDNLADDVDAAINIALDVKRRWLLSADNAERVEGPGLLPSELGVGIHVGKAYITRSRKRGRRRNIGRRAML